MSPDQMMNVVEEAAVKKAVRRKECLKVPANMTNQAIEPAPKDSEDESKAVMPYPKKLPMVDIFLNPNKTGEVAAIAGKKRRIAENYFKKSDMDTLFPQLFQILWQSTLPCFQGDLFHLSRINFFDACAFQERA